MVKVSVTSLVHSSGFVPEATSFTSNLLFVVLLNGNLMLKKEVFHSRFNPEMRHTLADSVFIVTVSEHVIMHKTLFL